MRLNSMLKRLKKNNSRIIAVLCHTCNIQNPGYLIILFFQNEINKITNLKFQYSMTKTFEILNFGHWDLFVICYLVLEILIFKDSTLFNSPFEFLMYLWHEIRILGVVPLFSAFRDSRAGDRKWRHDRWFRPIDSPCQFQSVLRFAFSQSFS